jgi:hypothetical protein
VGLIHSLGELLEAYREFRRGPWERLVRPVLTDIPARWLEEQTGLSRRTIQRLLPAPGVRRKSPLRSVPVRELVVAASAHSSTKYS